MPEGLRQHSKTVGLKQSKKALESDRAKAVYIAADADERVTARIIDLCNEKGIQIRRVDSMRLLGRACGIDIGTAVATIIDD